MKSQMRLFNGLLYSQINHDNEETQDEFKWFYNKPFAIASCK